MPKVPAQYLEARKNEILDAARACFLRRGFHQTTMQDICREAQLSPGAVYRYFRSKEDIINATIDRYTVETTRLIATARSLASSPDQAIQMIGRHFFARFQEPGFEQESLLELQTWPEILRSERLLGALRRQLVMVRQAFVEMFTQAQAEQRLAGPEAFPPEHLFSLVMAVWQGLRINLLLEREAVDPEAVFHILLRLFRQAEAAPQAPTPAEKGG